METHIVRGKMADDFVVAAEKYGSGSVERKYRFSAESGNVERIGRKRDTIGTSLKQFFKVYFCTMTVVGYWGLQENYQFV